MDVLDYVLVVVILLLAGSIFLVLALRVLQDRRDIEDVRWERLHRYAVRRDPYARVQEQLTRAPHASGPPGEGRP